MKNHKRFLLLGLFWLIIILVFIGFKEYTLRTGREVFLKTEPVDPRDLFRGDYVVLNYEISSLDFVKLGGESQGEFIRGEDIYVELDPKSKCASPLGIYRSKPNAELYIKGKIRRISDDVITDPIITVEYGIENYFVPEGTGRDIENLGGNDLVVRASVDKFGTAAIKAISIKGNECR